MDKKALQAESPVSIARGFEGYPEADQVRKGKPCAVCEFGPNDPKLGDIIPAKTMADGTVVYVHQGCIGTPRFPNLVESYKKEPENIWSFASKYRYIKEADDHELLQSTTPIIKTKQEAPAQRPDAGSAYDETGTPVPPKK